MKLPGDRLLFLFLTALVFAYIVLRAACVPIIHDEARTFQMFVITGEWLPFHANWDAGNHVLVTGLSQLSYPLLGGGLFALRIWSVAAFLLYALYAWRLGHAITSRTIRWCLWLSLLCMPFLLDFFSLFRGYAPAMALLLVSIFHASRYSSKGATKDLVPALLAMALASFGSLSLLIMWCAMIVALGLMAWIGSGPSQQRLRAFLWILALGVIPLVYAALFSAGLQVRGALYFGSEQGLFDGTLGTLAFNVLGTGELWPRLLISVVLLASLFVAARSIREGRLPSGSVMILCAALLVADLAGRLVLGEGFGVLYPTDRTALQYVPLFLVLLATVLDRHGERFPALRFLAGLMLAFPVRAVMTANYDRTVYWPEQSIPRSFFDLAEQRQRALDRPLLIGAYTQMVYCWNYGAALHGWRSNNPDAIDFPHATCDLLLIDTTFRTPPPGFRTIARAATGHNNLMERIVPLRTKVELDSSYSVPDGKHEFMEVWKPSQHYLPGHELIVDVEAVITAPEALRSDLVLEVSDSTGRHLVYDHYELDIARGAWHRDTVRLAMRLPPVDRTRARTVMYFYNPKHRRCAMDPVRLRVHSVAP